MFDEYEWRLALRASSASSNALLLGYTLMTYADNVTGQCFPTHAGLKKDMKKSNSPVTAAIQELEDKGFITVSRRGGKYIFLLELPAELLEGLARDERLLRAGNRGTIRHGESADQDEETTPMDNSEFLNQEQVVLKIRTGSSNIENKLFLKLETNYTINSSNNYINVRQKKVVKMEEAIAYTMMGKTDNCDVPKSVVEFYQDQYPLIDVDMQFQIMVAWLRDQPKNRRMTHFTKFIVNWLNKANQKPENYVNSRDGFDN